MKLIDGTPQAMKLISQLKAQSLLVDFYDQPYQQSVNPKYPSISDSTFSNFDEKYGDMYRNHLLGIYISSDFDIKKLLKVYPPLSPRFQDPGYAPIFIFINLAIQKIWCIKQTRKGSAIIITEDGQVLDEEIFEPDMPVHEFLELDHAKIIKRLYIALERITRADCMEFNGYSSAKEYREVVSWNLPTINKYFPNLNIQADELACDY